jgi:hypothetical protein
MPAEVLFSIITPSVGTRPLALAQAVRSVEAAVGHARELCGLKPGQVEMLVGFDGVKGRQPDSSLPGLHFYVLPRPEGGTCGFGNHIRNTLLRAAKGQRVLFLDDDNIFTPQAFALHLRHMDAEMTIGRVHTSRAFDVPFLPRPAPEGTDPVTDAVRQGNIDPLCLCLARELVVTRCGGWADEGGYESDFLNIRKYFRRARSVVRFDDTVGVYDAGRGLDAGGQNQRQLRLAKQGR